MFKAYNFLRTLHRDAAIDSMKNILALLGAGTILADFSTMKYWFMLPALVFSFMLWFADYVRHEGL